MVFSGTNEPEGKLATSSRPKRWRFSKPQLAPTDERLQRIEEESERVFPTVIKTLIICVFVAILMSVVAWVTLSVTVMPSMSVGDKYVLVKRAPWVQGKAPVGAVVVSQNKPADRDVVARIMLPVESGTNNSIYKITSAPGSNKKSPDYGVACVYNCNPQTKTLPTDYVLGELVGVVTTSGLQPLAETGEQNNV